jgi:hypothetical protein
VKHAGRWDTVEHLLAAVVDLLAAGNWQRGGGKGPKPKPVPRPQADGRRRGPMTDDEKEALLVHMDPAFRRALGRE